jgi:hypothetical protein
MDIYTEPDPLDTDVLANLGPLAPLAGHWEGDQGLDVSPSRDGAEETPYRERLSFDPMGPVVNGPQVLYGLRYATMAWRLGQDDPFHEELGYWLWEPAAQRVLRSFLVPRAVVVQAGGDVPPDARAFHLEAEVGSQTLGVLSNPFLAEAFQTVRYTLDVEIHDDGSFSYSEDTVLKIAGASELFHHTDRNTLRKV